MAAGQMHGAMDGRHLHGRCIVDGRQMGQGERQAHERCIDGWTMLCEHGTLELLDPRSKRIGVGFPCWKKR